MIVPKVGPRAWTVVALALIVGACSGGALSGAAPASYPAVTPPPGDAFAELMWRYGGQGDPSTSPIDVMWQDLMGDSYESPRAILPHRAGEPPPIACADMLPPEDWRDNAVYCHLDHTIAYDSAFLRAFHDRIDPQAAIAILAHEWGHHVQDHTGSGERDIQDELGADCYAGIFASTEELVGNAPPASLDGVATAFYELGDSDYSQSRWFVSDEHGSPFLRYTAWALGYTLVKLGSQVCGGYREWQPGQVADIGPYRLSELPGQPGERDERGDYRLDSETLPAFSIEYLDLPLGSTPEEHLDALIGERYGRADQRRVIGPADFARDPAGTAWAHVSTEPTSDGVSFSRHASIGLVTSPDDPGRGLFLTVEGEGSVPVLDDAPSEDDLTRVLEATQVLLTLAERVCAPHETADPGDRAVYNLYCREDL